MRFIEIEQVGSPIRRHRSQRSTLIGLGLNRIGRVSRVPDTPASRGMIAKVSHLVQIINDPSTSDQAGAPPAYDETADAALMDKLAFAGNGIVLEPYDDDARKRGKTPDFKLIKNGKIVGYCEMKSPRDDYVFETPQDGQPAIRKNVPFYRKLGSHVRDAAKQVRAVNPDHKLPNIVAFVSHAPRIEQRDLIATIAGLPNPGGPRIFLLGPKMRRQVMDAAREVDLYLWIDAKTGTLKHLSTNGAAHQQTALDLLGLSNEEPPEDRGEK
jgi:ribosomal protein L30